MENFLEKESQNDSCFNLCLCWVSKQPRTSGFLRDLLTNQSRHCQQTLSILVPVPESSWLAYPYPKPLQHRALLLLPRSATNSYITQPFWLLFLMSSWSPVFFLALLFPPIFPSGSSPSLLISQLVQSAHCQPGPSKVPLGYVLPYIYIKPSPQQSFGEVMSSFYHYSYLDSVKLNP